MFSRNVARITTQTFHLRKTSSRVIKDSGKCNSRVLTKATKAQTWLVLLTAALCRFSWWSFRASPVSHTPMALCVKTGGISVSCVEFMSTNYSHMSRESFLELENSFIVFFFFFSLWQRRIKEDRMGNRINPKVFQWKETCLQLLLSASVSCYVLL